MLRFSLARLARVARRRYGWVFLGVGLAVAAGLASASRLEFSTDVLGLLPADEPVVEQFRETLADFGSLDYFLVVVRVPAQEVLAPYEEYVELLGGRLDQLDQLQEVQYRFGRLEELISDFLPSAVLFLNERELETLAARVEDGALRVRAAEIRRLLATPQSVVLKDLLRLDPLGVADVFSRRFRPSRTGLKLDWASGFLLSSDQSMFLALAKPTRPAQDIDFARDLVATVENAVAATESEWRSRFGDDAPASPLVSLGGRHVIALGDASLIQRDVVANIVTSMVGVLILFLLAFRRFGPLLYAFVPLATGLVLTFGLSALAFGSMNAATSGVAAVLIGLGIDFVIVSYGRFVEERRRGRALEEALATMNGSSGRAVVVGGITSAATFFAFGVTDFTGLYQMGFLTGSGILLCMVAVLLLLPAMLAWSEDHHQRRASIPRRFLHGFGSGRLLPLAVRHPRPVLALALGVTLLAVWSSTGLRFDDSIQALRPRGNPGVEVRDEVAERFGLGFEQMMLVIEGDSLQDVVRRADEAHTAAARLVSDGVFQTVDSVATILPPPADQRRALEWLDAERRGRLDVQRIRARFEEALAAEGLRAAAFAEGLDLFARAIGRDRPLGVEEIASTPRGAKLLERYLLPKGNGWKSVVYLYPPPKMWRREAPPQALALADSLPGTAYLTGGNLVSAFLRGRVLEDALLASALGFVVVGFLIWLDYRRLRDTLLSLAPLVMGIVWMLGAMAMLDIPMNFMNIFVSTMIIGIGVDYGLHMIHRYREFAGASPERLHAALAETGKAVTLAALSTVVGFGSLARSHFGGLSSMGIVAILGAMATCLVAITVLPAFLALLESGSGRREGPESERQCG
jgi:predicted RND superfamily exporter protein